MYTSEEAAVTAIRELGVGWAIFPYDDPERGVLGYSAIRTGEEQVFQWPVFGQVLMPHVEVVEPSDLVVFFQEEPRTLLTACDNPMRREIGFVSYREAPSGLAIVRRTQAMKVKVAPLDVRATLLEWHAKLFSHPNRLTAAQALKPYGWLRVRVMRLVRRFFPLR
jgi:hypothetical protein